MAEGNLVQHRVTRAIIGAFYEVYNHLGPGFLEAFYALAMERELRARGHSVVREVAVRVMYKGEELGRQRLDMIVDGVVVVEIKSTPSLAPVARRQLHAYLRATNLEVGLLLHFGPDPKFHRSLSPTRQGQTVNPDESDLIRSRR
ncbi:MAG TPA: GxxExxY protein [Gemmatimonadaceae bacterium]|nr:GxxExxY protein [Gemmatimonadaceae bacterium]